MAVEITMPAAEIDKKLEEVKKGIKKKKKEPKSKKNQMKPNGHIRQSEVDAAERKSKINTPADYDSVRYKDRINRSKNATSVSGENDEEFIKSEKKDIDPDEIIEPDGKEAGPIIDVNPEDITEIPKYEVALRENKLDRIKQKLEQARKDYAMMDYKKGALWKRVYNYFGDNIKRGGRVKKDSDLAYYEAIYDNKLLDYKNALLQNIKEKGLTGEALEKELADVIKIIDTEGGANLYNARTEARAESSLNAALIIKGLKKVVNGYIKLKWKKKIALAVGLGLASVSVAAGGAALGTFGVIAGTGITIASVIRRIFAGSAVAIGTEASLEEGAEKYREIMSNRKVKEYLESQKNLEKLEGMTDEGKIDKVGKLLEEDVFNADAQLQKRKWGSLFRKTGAAFFGAAIGSGILTHWISEKTGFGKEIHNIIGKLGKTAAGEWVMEKIHLGGGMHHPEVRVPAWHNPEEIAQRAYEQDINPHGIPVSPEIQPEPTPEISHELSHEPMNEPVHEPVPEMSHELSHEPMHEPSPEPPPEAAPSAPEPTHEAAPESSQYEVNQEHPYHEGVIAQDNISPDSHSAGLTPEEIDKIKDYEDSTNQEMKVGSTMPEAAPEGNFTPEVPPEHVPETSHDVTGMENTQPAHPIEPIEPEIKIEKDISQGNMAGHESISGKINELIGSTDSVQISVAKFRSDLFLGNSNEWRLMENTSVNQALKELRPNLKDSLTKFLGKSVDILGNEAKPLEGLTRQPETMKEWTERVARLLLEKK